MARASTSRLRASAVSRVVLVGDRGRISQTAVEQLRTHEGLAWITALKSAQIRKLVEGGALQIGLFEVLSQSLRTAERNRWRSFYLGG